MMMRNLAVMACVLAATPAFGAMAIQGPSSSETPYLVPTRTNVNTVSILSAGDWVNLYRMPGTPDGLGAFDNGDGTFTLVSNHEFNTREGAPTAFGASAGSLISRWRIDTNTLAVIHGGEQIHTLNLTSGGPNELYRFCSADLAPVSAFYNATTGNGSTERIFLNGEEGSLGRGFAHVLTGPLNGNSYEIMPGVAGAWENLLAHPNQNNVLGDTTLVMGDSDGLGNNVWAYIGQKTTTGSPADMAGLTNGTGYRVAVSVNNSFVSAEDRTGGIGGALDGSFTLTTGTGTTFLRPEDGAWDPTHPNDFYFNTTDRLDQVADGVGSQVGHSRLWKLHFDDITNPTAGGTISAVLDGTEGINMLDNLAIDEHGRILLQEDVGGAEHNGKIWLYDIASDSLTLIAMHDPVRFGDIGVPGTLTQDEESSAIIDAEGILGPGWFLLTDQSHYDFGDPAIVEGGQLLAIYVPMDVGAPVPEPASLGLLALAAGAVLARRR